MSFLRRLSSATSSFLSNPPNAQGLPLSSISHGPAENRRQSVPGGADKEKLARASWEIPDADSVMTRGLFISKKGLSGYASSSDFRKNSFDSVNADYHDCDSIDGSIGASSDEDTFVRDKYDMMVHHLWNVGEREGWFRDMALDGVVSIRVRKRTFRTFPQPRSSRIKAKELITRIQEWDAAISTLNPEVAMKISSKVVQAIMARCAATAIEIVLDVNTRIQILDDFTQLAGARKHQFAAFIRSESCLVVWTDEVETLIPSAQALERRMIAYVWLGRHRELRLVDDAYDIIPTFRENEEGWVDRDAEREKFFSEQMEETQVGAKDHEWEMRDRRPMMLYAPLVSGLAMIMTFAFIGSGIRGSVNIFVFDDGMQLWDEEEREIRKAYYDRNNIGWTARPKHGQNGYIRKGRFKKASNMNFGIRLSLRVEEIMDELRPIPNNSDDHDWVWTDDDERDIYNEALMQALEESNGVAWASGNIRIGELILIIDSDTRVPEDCFLDAASELNNSPNVAIIQHESAVMQVVGHFFENGITSFTTRINTAISFCAANGEVAPFVGHNAFLRWSAIQDASFIDNEDGLRKCWSESHVSEDFDQALRLQMRGWSLRWASYSNGGFQEGVSLTADDELRTAAWGAAERVLGEDASVAEFGQKVLDQLFSIALRPTVDSLYQFPRPSTHALALV
ncbi:hypothetical protein D1P53_003277 [Cryptococcus gattii VGV]|nr:hypothetical protein D1P53_003277 [Cryptococcus gattii VGV]